MSTTHPSLFIFDVDGTLRWTTIPGRRYPIASGEWKLMPGVRRTLSAIPWGPETRLAVASNQHGIALGELSRTTALDLIEETLIAAIGRIPPGTVIEICPHDPEGACACRKPSPGMLVSILRTTGVARQNALYVGDLDIDREAARQAGVPFRLAREFFAEHADTAETRL